jgi:hypothetical protein
MPPTCQSFPLQFFTVSLVEGKSERPQFWSSLGDEGRIAGGAEHPHRTQLPGCITEMSDALVVVPMHENGLIQWWR